TEVASSETTTARAPAQTVRWILLAVSICAVAFLAIMAVKWPFTREAMTKRLERASSAQVEMRSFHGTYFPFPGCIAEEVMFRQKTSAKKTKRRTTIRTTTQTVLSACLPT